MHYEIEIYAEFALLVVFSFCLRATWKDFSPIAGIYCLALFLPAIIWPLHCWMS